MVMGWRPLRQPRRRRRLRAVLVMVQSAHSQRLKPCPDTSCRALLGRPDEGVRAYVCGDWRTFAARVIGVVSSGARFSLRFFGSFPLVLNL